MISLLELLSHAYVQAIADEFFEKLEQTLES